MHRPLQFAFFLGSQGPALLLAALLVAAGPTTARADEKVSYYQQIRPLLQANCHGCHQPSLDRGSYVMTDFGRLTEGGESELRAIVPGQPDESYLVELITPVDGSAEMPQGKKPLRAAEVELIRQWVQEGAHDDTPEGAKQVIDSDHPPVYSRPPVITAIDFSPNGEQLAVAGFHEVLVSDVKSGELVARLVGVSERIESIQYSPDGGRLLVTGGLPCRMGEVQVWDLESRQLQLSVPVTYDTVYGGSWSPDGKLIAFGCADNVLRAIDAETGEQILFQGAHSDWVRDTVFSLDGTHLISVGRDMSCKLTEVATERFVDNITSITPGVLKGGVNAVARHPQRDEIVVGGADGQAKVYRVFRQTARRIGDDANLIRRMPSMRGRIFDVAVNSSGTRFAAVSSLNGEGQLHVYSYEFDTELPEEIKRIQSKTVQSRSAEEKATLDEYHSQGVEVIADVAIDGSGLYAVAFSPSGDHVATAGSDGRVRLFATETGEPIRELAPAPMATEDRVASQFSPVPTSIAETSDDRPAPEREVTKLIVEPESILLDSEFAYAQIVVTGKLAGGGQVDLTRHATTRLTSQIAAVSPNGFVSPLRDGDAMLAIEWDGRSTKIPVRVTQLDAGYAADFIRDVNPVLSRVGCNLGTCHGSANGKNGFKLSLRGYDPLFDTRALTDDLASRRTSLASPDNSLMLLKATAAVPHLGGQLLQPGEPYYRLVRGWIAGGAKLDLNTPRVTKLDVFPRNPVIEQIGRRQQVRVVATYADGTQRDVTREAFVESGDTEIAAANRTGLMTALRRGEAPVLARYEGAYAATTLTVMGERDAFVWRQPETWGRVDELVAAKWQRMKIQPSELCSDAEFIRRVSIDLLGLPPTAEQVQEFLADQRESRVKRAELVDQLIGNEEYVEYWTNKWSDLLQVNRKFLGAEGAAAFREWIREHVAENTPYDEFARQILTASGSNKDNPAASYFKILRDPESLMENTTHLFLAVRFNCNKCHDHPFERWTQDQYYETAAYFARVGLKADPASGKRKIGGTAVEGAKPFYEVVYERETGEVEHNRTGAVTPPEFPFDCDFERPDSGNRREELAAWITSPDNQYCAKSYVNRLWGYLLGVGIIEPIDDLRASNPPSNPQLMDYLTDEFIESGFDIRHMIGMICKSRTYQLSVATNRWNEDDKRNYSHATARRLPAEVLYDSIYQVTGTESKIPGVPPGTRAAALPDSGIKLADGFLANLGRPARESACECERVNDLQLGPVMALIGGPTVAEAIADSENAIVRLVENESNDARLVNKIFLRVLNRPASADEVAAFLDNLHAIADDHHTLAEELLARESWWKERKPQLEQERQESLAAAKADLEAYEQEIAPRIAEEKRTQAEHVERLQAKLDNYLAEAGPKITQWEQQHAQEIEWLPLAADAVKASNDLKLVRQPDRSLLVVGDAKRAVFTVEVNTQLRGITGVRLEALPLQEGNQQGPGLTGGNFVLTEFEMQAAGSADPEKFEPVGLRNPLADFEQANLGVSYAVDGKADDRTRGWGIGPATKTVHWATFETKQPVGSEGGTRLRFKLHHQREGLVLGRFRLSVTLSETPLGVGLPEALAGVVATTPDERTDDQRTRLANYFAQVDSEAIKLRSAVATAKRPLPEDRGLTQRKQTVAALSQEIADDGRLLQLRRDVEQSKRQAEQPRLTAAQDLVWALINNPSFLFNR